MEYVSEIYEGRGTACVRLIMERWVRRRAWIGVVAVAALIVAAVAVDSAFAFVAAMVVFIVMPFVLMMVYFNYGLKPTTAVYSLPQRLKIERDMLSVEFLKQRGDDEGYEVSDRKLVKFKDIIAMTTVGNNLALITGNGPDEFVILPFEAFCNDEGDVRVKFEEIIYETIQRK